VYGYTGTQPVCIEKPQVCSGGEPCEERRPVASEDRMYCQMIFVNKAGLHKSAGDAGTGYK
jgi:hypothetical protein